MNTITFEFQEYNNCFGKYCLVSDNRFDLFELTSFIETHLF